MESASCNSTRRMNSNANTGRHVIFLSLQGRGGQDAIGQYKLLPRQTQDGHTDTGRPVLCLLLQGKGGPDAPGQYELLHRQAQAAAADLLAGMRGEHPDHVRQRRESVADMIVELAESFAAQHKVEAVSSGKSQGGGSGGHSHTGWAGRHL